MISEFYLDTEVFSEEERARFETALQGLAEGDCPFCFELLLVDEEEIQRLNRDIRGVDRVTDVLSFPSLEGIKGKPLFSDEYADDLDEEDRLFLGSIVVCEARARQQALEYGHSYERELYYLTVHGVLHCLGYDHETEEEKREMREKEEEVMQRLGLTR